MDLVDQEGQEDTECMAGLTEDIESMPAYIIDLIWRHDIITEEW